MTDPTALAILQDGSRIPLSDPLDEARRHWRDGEYDTDVIGIEAVKEARAPPPDENHTQQHLVGPAPAPPEHVTRTKQLAIAFDER